MSNILKEFQLIALRNAVYIVGDQVHITNFQEIADPKSDHVAFRDFIEKLKDSPEEEHFFVAVPLTENTIIDYGVVTRVAAFIPNGDKTTYTLKGVAVSRVKIFAAAKGVAVCAEYTDDIPEKERESLLVEFKEVLKNITLLLNGKTEAEMLIGLINEKKSLRELCAHSSGIFESLGFYPDDEKLKILTSPTQEEYYRRLIDLLKNLYGELEEKISKKRKESEMKKEKGNDLRKRYEEIKNFIPEESRKFFEKDFQNLQDPYSKADQHLEFLLSLPWGRYTHDIDDLKTVKDVLDADHYGLNKIKERIMEFIAVRKLNPKGKAPILTFVGPPGVGKTSLGKSIAEAMGRKFIRTALGGIRDEGEIRGHSSTYIGAQEGRILREIVNAGSSNPVFMIDEVDKLTNNGAQGNPSAALLEVLDPEQNYSFKDTYARCPFDLSQVFFICTANVLDDIPDPLRDRMEIIILPSYSEKEKVSIAQNFLVPKQKKETGIETAYPGVAITDEQIMNLIERTREAGVRGLEKKISALFRKIIVKHLTEKQDVDIDKIIDQLGPLAHRDRVRKTPSGVATGLAYTGYGGHTLRIETIWVKKANTNPDKISLTGNLGETMRQSAKIAMSVVRKIIESETEAFNFEDKMFHLHVPAGAIPKDGPSAGSTMACSIYSSIREKPLKPYVAMTGEITLEGEILPIGGLEEKIPAAIKAGVRLVLIPKENKAEVERLDDFEEIKKSITIKYVGTIHDIFRIVFNKKNK